MPSGESLDAKLARISGRLSSEREDIRARVQADPTLAYLADLAWNRTGPNGGLLYFRQGDYTRGRDLPPGIIPAEPFRVNHAEPGPREARRTGTKATSSDARADQGYVAGLLLPQRPRSVPAKKGQTRRNRLARPEAWRK